MGIIQSLSDNKDPSTILDRCALKSSPFSFITMTASALAGAPGEANRPADVNDQPGMLRARCLAIISAIGDLQVFPVHTNKIDEVVGFAIIFILCPESTKVKMRRAHENLIFRCLLPLNS